MCGIFPWASGHRAAFGATGQVSRLGVPFTARSRPSLHHGRMEKFRKPLLIAAAVIGVVVLGLCGVAIFGGSDEPTDDGTPTTQAAEQCESAPADLTASVAEGLRDGAALGGGAVIVETDTAEQTDTGWPWAIYAAPVTWDGGDGVGTWGVGASTAEGAYGLTIALNDAAQAATTWGEAAQAGSAAAENRETAAGLEAAAAAESCASLTTAEAKRAPARRWGPAVARYPCLISSNINVSDCERLSAGSALRAVVA